MLSRQQVGSPISNWTAARPFYVPSKSIKKIENKINTPKEGKKRPSSLFIGLTLLDSLYLYIYVVNLCYFFRLFFFIIFYRTRFYTVELFQSAIGRRCATRIYNVIVLFCFTSVVSAGPTRGLCKHFDFRATLCAYHWRLQGVICSSSYLDWYGYFIPIEICFVHLSLAFYIQITVTARPNRLWF